MMTEQEHNEYPPIEQYAVGLRFVCGQHINTVSELKRLIDNLPSFKLRPAILQDGHVIPLDDISSYVDTAMIDLEEENRISGGLLRGVMLRLIPEQYRAKAFALFDWSVFDSGCNKIDISVTIYAEPEGNKHNELGDKIIELVQYIEDKMKPEYGVVYDPDRETPSALTEDIEQLRFPQLGWRTFFGPGYIDKYGAELISNIPACECSMPNENGLLLQSRPGLAIPSMNAYRHWERAYRDYLELHGVSVV